MDPPTRYSLEIAHMIEQPFLARRKTYLTTKHMNSSYYSPKNFHLSICSQIIIDIALPYRSNY